jgi:DNA-binding MarR family transcriptional regulator
MPDHALTEQEALNALRQAGVIEAASITALGEGWNWERSRTSKAVIRWERAGHIEREPGTGRKIVIRMREGGGNGNGTPGTVLVPGTSAGRE